MEAEVTGRLEHPGVVPVYGLGVYPDGRPYYAMRFVRGEDLKSAAESFHAAPGDAAAKFASSAFRQLLARFIAVCNAVAYAHSRGVLHRDLKPANIMLGKFGETLVVDWGLAKVVGRGDAPGADAEETLLPSSGGSNHDETAAGAAVGTPAFMSPEQAAGMVRDLGPATDVYSLGATLYTLLTNHAPFAGADIGALLQRVQRGEWRSPRSLNPATPPPLDAICRKAMALKPDQRYATPLSLAEDLERWLADEPIVAHEEPLPQRLRRRLRKRPALAASAAALLAASLLFGVIGFGLHQSRLAVEAEKDQTEQARASAENARQAAVEAEADAAALGAFLVNDVLARARPEELGGLGVNVTVRQALRAAQANIGRVFTKRPRAEGQVRLALGVTFLSCGEHAAAVQELETAVERCRASFGPAHAVTADAESRLSEAYRAVGRLVEATKLAEGLVARAAGGPTGQDAAALFGRLGALAEAYRDQGRLAEALTLFERIVNEESAKLGAHHPKTLSALAKLAASQAEAGRYDEALPVLESTLEQRRRVLGPDHLDTLQSMDDLASACQAVGRMKDALPLLSESLTRKEKRLGEEHPETLRALNNLAVAQLQIGRLTDALALLERSNASSRKVLGPDHPLTLNSMNNLARAYMSAGKLDFAIKLLEETQDRLSGKLGADHPNNWAAMSNLALAYQASGKDLDAARLLHEVHKMQQAKLGEKHPSALTTLHNLAAANRALEKHAEAAKQFEQAYRARAQVFGETHPSTLESAEEAASAYLAANQAGKAAELQRIVLASMRKTLSPDDPRLGSALARAARALLADRQPGEAEKLLRESLTLRERKEPDSWTTFNSKSLLGEALLLQKNFAEAERLLLEGFEGMEAREKQIPQANKSRLAEAAGRLVQLYEAIDKPQEADKWRKEHDRLADGK